MKPYRIPELARPYVTHDMIQQHTELPEFPDARMRLLFAFLTHDRATAERSELYALVVSLVQLGMDTHDLVEEGAAPVREEAMRARQLKVLAGDYFSGRFYYLLSQAGQIELIRKISHAVCEVNRKKVTLYSRMKQLRVTAEEYLQSRIQLKSGLLHVFGTLLSEPNAQLWPTLSQRFTQCEVVAQELQRACTPAHYSQSWAYWHVLQLATEEEKKELRSHREEPKLMNRLIEKYQIRNQLADKLRAAIHQLQLVVERLESDKLGEELRQLGERFALHLDTSAPAYNEMR